MPDYIKRAELGFGHLYSERERAALVWTEALTLISETGAPDAD